MTVVALVIFLFAIIGIIAVGLCQIFSDSAEEKRMREEDAQVTRDRKVEAHLRDEGYGVFGIDSIFDDYTDKKAFLTLHNVPYQNAVYNHSMIGYSDNSYKHSDPKDALWVRDLAAVEEAYKIYKEQLNKIRKDELHQKALNLLIK